MQSVDFITYGTETLALCAAIPDWAKPMQLDILQPGDVTSSLLRSESRRRFSTSQRYDFSHFFTADNAADATDIRKWLERLKIETVAAPLWPDEMLLHTACTPHATTLDVTGSQLPVRSGAEWIIMRDDGSQFEIVVVTALTATTVTLASPGTTFGWPAGAALYPLMFGRLLDERPKLTSMSDETFSTTFTFHEMSPFARKLNPRVVPQQLMGAHGGEFALSKLWTVEPDWDAPVDWTESDILRKAIPATFPRVEQQYAYQDWNRRGIEIPFTCDRDEAAAIEYFFNERKGTNSNFFLPTFRGDLRLAADIAPGDITFEIEESRYEIASYDEQPGNAFLALIDDSGIYPQRITDVAETTITPIVPVGEAHRAAETQICFLKLVRFAESKLSWEITSDDVYKTRIKFIEVPSEYTTPAPAISPPAYLFHWQEKTPAPNDSYFTSYEDSIVFAGNTYTPAPFGFDRYKKSLTEDFILSSWGGDFVGNPMNRFIPYVLNATMSLTIIRVNRDNPDDGSDRILYYGDMLDLDATGPDWKGNFRPFGRRFAMKFPRFNQQKQDNFILFTSPMQLSPDAFTSIGAIATLAGFTLVVSGSAQPDDWFSQGYLFTGTGANFERRSIRKSSVAGTVQTLTIDRPLVHAIAGQAISMVAGYDGSRTQCASKFNNNVKFGGHDFAPPTNPVVTPNDIPVPTGGKK